MDLATYRRLGRLSVRLSRRAGEAEDLLQDTLLAALQAGRDEPAWLAGTMRRIALDTARGAARRRRRDGDFANLADGPAGDDVATGAHGEPRDPHRVHASATAVANADPRPLLAALPPSARRVAILALHGLDAAEIRWILGIADTAFRQRLSRIRKALGELPPEQQAQARALAFVRDPARTVDLQFGLVRRALKAALAGRDGLASHDPDGHLLVLRSGAHGSAPGGNRD